MTEAQVQDFSTMLIKKLANVIIRGQSASLVTIFTLDQGSQSISSKVDLTLQFFSSPSDFSRLNASSNSA
jgi:hypothetical protein